MDILNTFLHECASASVAGAAITSPEEDEVIRRVCDFATRTAPSLNRDNGNARKVYVWHQSTGFRRYGLFDRDDAGRYIPVAELSEDDTRNLACRPIADDVIETEDYDAVFGFMRDYDPKMQSAGVMFLLCDWHNFIGNQPKDPSNIDAQKVFLKETSQAGSAKTVIMLSPTKWDIPVEMEQVVRVLDLPLPDKGDRLAKVQGYVNTFRNNPETHSQYAKAAELTDREVEMVADACAGLTLFQMENVLLMSLASHEGNFDKDFVLREKRQMLKGQGIELIEPKYGYDDVGGLEPVKAWARRYRNRFTQAAFDYGFPRFPRGAFLTGVPGTGKSLFTTILCKEWGMNGIYVKATSIKGSLVGESEQKAETILKQAKANAPCLLVVGEGDKLFASTDASRDGGASQGVLSLFLEFMQEDDSGVFTVFTLNEMNNLPRELIDRFEGRFFFDLPTEEERTEIFNIHIKRFNRKPKDYDIKSFVDKTDGFNGRGIEAAVCDAFGAAFADGEREPTNDDFVTAFEFVGAAADQKTIESLREEAKAKHLVAANRPRKEAQAPSGQPMDFSRV